MGIEIRFLTRDEFNQLLTEAPDTETKNLLKIPNPYEFLIENSLEKEGLIIDNKPVYLAVLSKDKELWTVVNSNVKEQFTLFKNAKRYIKKWSDKYGMIYATMEKVNPKNMRWTERLGFERYNETDFIITYIKRS